MGGSFVMPKIYRVMIEFDGKPAVGSQRDMLGVREGSPPGDISVTGDEVTPGTGGMSVNICPYQMPAFIIPRHLREQSEHFRGAKGKRGTRIWSMGEGEFIRSSLTSDLTLAPDSQPEGVIADHGCIEPSVVMPVGKFQESLSATQDLWTIDERINDDCPICRQSKISPSR